MEHRLNPTDLRRVVREELQNALDNEETLVRWTVREIAEDMVSYSQPLELESTEDLIPHIAEWLSEKSQKTS